jgi:uncharacterized protein YdeI (YjbR/CyaY-like superfamily)
MGKFNKNVDAYVARAASFAQPILEHLREVVHKACPDVEETVKWGFPHFEYNGILCSMAGFKQHCSFGFWKGSIMKDPYKVMTIVGKTSMGSFDRITSMKDLPSDKILLQYIKEAMQLNENDVKLPSRSKPRENSKPVETPDYFLKALGKNKKALAVYEAFSNSHRKEYVEWIREAKTDDTRAKRIETALEWIAEGKGRNWKYVRK